MKKVIALSLFCLFFTYNSFGVNYTIPTQESVKANANKIANWQMANFTYSSSGNLHDNGISSWTHSVLYLGLSEWAKIEDPDAAYSDWLYNIATKSQWKLNGIYPYHGDEFCVSQFFVSMYRKHQDEKMLSNTIQRVDYILNNPPNSSMSYKNKQAWTWCDALFMAPPLYAQLSSIKNDGKYLDFMDKEVKKTYNHLFDKSEKLFFRDDSYFDKTEANGEKVFWGRGNGWALAGIANILKALPANSEYRSYYEGIFRDLALSLIAIPDRQGGWHASLLDPDSYPAVETSATALITYALIYGLNNDLLTEAEALRPALKAWSKLCDAIHDNGKLGWVQPIGQDPKTITKDMTATFGVGAFFLAASEMYIFLNNNQINLAPEIEFLQENYNLIKGNCIKPEMCFFAPVKDRDIEFQSSDSKVVQVQPDGSLCAIAAGTAVISATYKPNPTKTATCIIDVTETSYFKNVFFDFGSSLSPVSENALKVSSKTLFTENTTYGWLSSTGLGERYLSKPADNLELRGFIAGAVPATFKVLLENGQYDVTLTQGDADYPHEYMIVKANGVSKLENITSAKGSYEINTFEVEVDKNDLELEFSKVKQGDPNWVVNSVKINRKAASGLDKTSMDGLNNPKTKITIYDLAGKELLSTSLGLRNVHQILDANKLRSGVYLVRYQLGRESKVVKYVL